MCLRCCALRLTGLVVSCLLLSADAVATPLFCDNLAVDAIFCEDFEDFAPNGPCCAVALL